MICDFAVSLPGTFFALNPLGEVQMYNPYKFGLSKNNWNVSSEILYDEIQSDPVAIVLRRNSIKYPIIVSEHGCCMWKSNKKSGVYAIKTVIKGYFTGVECSSDGGIMALWSCFSSDFLIYDFATMKSQKYSIVNGGVISLKFSHSCKYLVLSTTESKLKILDLIHLHWEDWLIDSGVEDFCISNDDNHILVVQRNTSMIYHFYSNGFMGEEGKSPIDQFVLQDMFNLSKKGLIIQNIQISSHEKRMLIVFHQTDKFNASGVKNGEALNEMKKLVGLYKLNIGYNTKMIGVSCMYEVDIVE